MAGTRNGASSGSEVIKGIRRKASSSMSRGEPNVVFGWTIVLCMKLRARDGGGDRRSRRDDSVGVDMVRVWFGTFNVVGERGSLNDVLKL